MNRDFLVSPMLVATLLFGISAVRGTEPEKASDKKKLPESTIKLEIASFAQIQEAVAKHKGKVVVVDYWSSWCSPCLKELPEFVQLHKELGDKIVCITVDVDFAGAEDEKPQQHHDNVLGILTKNQATMRNFISSDPDLTVFDKLRVASVPALHVFDPAGKLHQRFDNENGTFGDEGFSVLKHVKPVVAALLK
jgi:thiol-disulfide isomerase/thioredoxin